MGLLTALSQRFRNYQTAAVSKKRWVHGARARLAVDYFVYRVNLNAGMLAAALGGLDAFVFTAGIGENSAEIRARIAEIIGLVRQCYEQQMGDGGQL
jgi:acetate kinase